MTEIIGNSNNRPQELVNSVFEGKNTPLQNESLLNLKNYYEGQGDAEAYDEIISLREKHGGLEDWKRTKEQARSEMKEIPDDILLKLLEKATPLMRNLPAGHGIGHMTRDAVYLKMIMSDESMSKYDSVELFTGVVAGMFHDIGYSVVGRYDEPKRFAGHAEVGAHLFGLLSQNMMGENLRKMTQLAIAGHTHYLKERSATKFGETKAIGPYDDEVVDGNRMAYWIARQTDRMDAQGPLMAFRHMLTITSPTEDFDGKEFYATWEDASEDFKHQFNPVLRNGTKRSAEPKPANSANILEHISMFAQSNFNDKLPYAKNDNPTMRKMIVAAAQEQGEFIIDVLSQSPTLPEEEIEKAISNWSNMAGKVEPAYDLSSKLEDLKSKMELLSPEQKSQWANGFNSLCTRLYPRMWERLNSTLESNVHTVHDDDDQVKSKVQTILDKDLSELARAGWSKFKPL